MGETYDLVIAGGRVIDPAQGIDGRLDVGIKGGRIAALGQDLAARPAGQVLAVPGAIVCPGLVDLHVHVYEWVTNFGLWVDDAGVDAGVTTVVDQGSAGAWTYGGFKAHVIEPARTTVRAFVSINLAGALKGGMEGTRLHNPTLVDVDELVALAAAEPEHIRGFKCHAESGSQSHWGVAVLEQAARAGKRAGLPLYVHTGELFPVDEGHRPPIDSVLPAALPLLKAGDVLAHVYSSMPDGVVGQGKGIPDVVRRARDQGVLFDIGYGVNFSYAIARKLMAADIFPDTISSDAHGDFNAYHDDSKLDYSLCGAMTRLLALGMPLDKIIAATTSRPAAVLQQSDRLGALRPGMPADVTVLDRVAGEWVMHDGSGAALTVGERLVPAHVVKAGTVIAPRRRLLRDLGAPSMPLAAD
jgi:dihydroorotase